MHTFIVSFFIVTYAQADNLTKVQCINSSSNGMTAFTKRNTKKGKNKRNSTTFISLNKKKHERNKIDSN